MLIGVAISKSKNSNHKIKLSLAISANIADVKFYHNTIAAIGSHFKQTVAGILSVDSFYVRYIKDEL